MNYVLLFASLAGIWYGVSVGLALESRIVFGVAFVLLSIGVLLEAVKSDG